MDTKWPETQPATDRLNVLVVGASGGTGVAVVKQLLSENHHVTAFSRHATRAFQRSPQLTPIDGDVMQPQDLQRVMPGHDVVIVVLGISDNPMRVRLFKKAGTALNVRSKGTLNVINAMQQHGVERLVVQSSYGVGETRSLLRAIDKLFFALLLKPQIEDTEQQELLVRSSGLQWVLAQPVHLTDSNQRDIPFLSVSGEVRAMKVARQSVARFLSVAALSPEFFGKTVSVSG